MALVFFGPRKLRQLSRNLCKNLAEFRRASEDFQAHLGTRSRLEDLQSEPMQVQSNQTGKFDLNP